MSGPAPPADPAFEPLLEFLNQARGFDFSGYKRASLERRIRRRLEQVSCAGFVDYLDYLQVHPEEYERLFNAILINVTEFFRDPPAWDHLREHSLPALLRAKPHDEPIRVWSAGCSTGQEACTLAMVFAELLGVEDYCARVKIYATDIDEEALAQARQATYGPRETESLPPELAEKYFISTRNSLEFRKELRRTLIFGRNDLVSDAPISRLDLLVCRNTLMYLTAETQSRIMRHFHFALRDDGILMLGRSEMMTSNRERFVPDDLKKRIFRKVPQTATLQSRVVTMSGQDMDSDTIGSDDRLAREAALEGGAHAQLILSRSGIVTFANLAARTLFELDGDAIGRPLADGLLTRTPAGLQRAVEEAVRERRRVVIGEFALERGDGSPRRLGVAVDPLAGGEDGAVGVSVTFEDVTRVAAMEDELERSRRDLQAAYEELESTIDELETTNEELQSANEELQTTNEELQSTNEELETMNEELQSTNEELETINDELRERTGEINELNEFLEVILTSLSVGVAVVDRSGSVQVWNRGAEELWGLRPEEAVDRNLLALDIGLGPERLAPALRAVLSERGRQSAVLEAVNRRGRAIRCAVSVLPLIAGAGEDAEVRGAIVLMEDEALDGAGISVDGSLDGDGSAPGG